MDPVIALCMYGLNSSITVYHLQPNERIRFGETSISIKNVWFPLQWIKTYQLINERKYVELLENVKKSMKCTSFYGENPPNLI